MKYSSQGLTFRFKTRFMAMDPCQDTLGPYSVGMVDIELPIQSRRIFSRITSKTKHMLRLMTVLFSL